MIDPADMNEEEFAEAMKQFVAERDAALLSMDMLALLAFGEKWGVDWKFTEGKEHIFWASVHVARTGAKGLPRDERIESRDWLAERNLRHLGDDL